MTKDELTLAKIEDKITQSRDGWYVTATGFLDGGCKDAHVRRL